MFRFGVNKVKRFQLIVCQLHVKTVAYVPWGVQKTLSDVVTVNSSASESTKANPLSPQH